MTRSFFGDHGRRGHATVQFERGCAPRSVRTVRVGGSVWPDWQGDALIIARSSFGKINTFLRTLRGDRDGEQEIWTEGCRVRNLLVGEPVVVFSTQSFFYLGATQLPAVPVNILIDWIFSRLGEEPVVIASMGGLEALARGDLEGIDRFGMIVLHKYLVEKVESLHAEPGIKATLRTILQG
ncbi:MAG: hypothetical protein AB1405_09250 [Bdellovibrionota bacterium]